MMNELGAQESPQTGAAGEGKSVKICEDPDSKAHMEALFKVAETGPVPRSQQGGKPMKDRELPESFFTGGAAGRPTLGPRIDLGRLGGGGAHAHSISLPARMEGHRQQHSYDSGMNALQNLPPGWEMGCTEDGTPYYIE